MLDRTLATTFTPGTNLKGEVAAANWTFLLPGLELERIVSLGMPAPAELATLGRMGRVIVVIDQEEAADSDGSMGLETVVMGRPARFALADDCVDLLFVAGERYRSLLDDDVAMCAEVQRILKPQGVLYVEPSRWLNNLSAPDAGHRQRACFDAMSAFWLTPLRGHAHTAVPAQSRQAMTYFLDKGLHSPSVTASSFAAVKSLLKRRRPQRAASAVNGSPLPAAANTARPDFLPGTRAVAESLLDLLGGAERLVLKHLPRVRRQGILFGSSGHLQPGRLPQYLVDLAQASGLDLSDRRHWGVVARGDYSSRKVLFFLFDEGPRRGAELKPAYVVKMVRDAQYNARLENEQRALALLEELGVAVPETAPRVAFWGYHNRLAIIGETAIAGQPFRARTSATADCPYLLSALDWFTMLASRTVDADAATPREAATVLRKLLARFTEIYRLSADHEAFLERQLTRVADRTPSFPLVFQHGDPGPWNAVVTPDDRVAFLDWEAAEAQGMPLWDLFYFIRSYSMGVARAQGTHDRLHGFAETLLSDTPLSRLLLERVEGYRQETDLDPALVEPLFYTCWMHRALKEATRLSPSRLDKGHYVNLLRLCIEWRDKGMLRRLFAQPRSPGPVAVASRTQQLSGR